MDYRRYTYMASSGHGREFNSLNHDQREDCMEPIADAVANDTCILFAGAGLSRDAGLPDWVGFGLKLKEELGHNGKLPPDCLSAVTALLGQRERVPAAIDLMLSIVP